MFLAMALLYLDHLCICVLEGVFLIYCKIYSCNFYRLGLNIAMKLMKALEASKFAMILEKWEICCQYLPIMINRSCQYGRSLALHRGRGYS